MIDQTVMRFICVCRRNPCLCNHIHSCRPCSTKYMCIMFMYKFVIEAFWSANLSLSSGFQAHIVPT